MSAWMWNKKIKRIIIELNQRHNALITMIQELSKHEYEQRDELRCALLYARGENFTTGFD